MSFFGKNRDFDRSRQEIREEILKDLKYREAGKAEPKPEVVTKVVIGEPTMVKVYRAYKESVVYGPEWVRSNHIEDRGFFLSCEEAFKAADGGKVDEVRALVIDGEYLSCPYELTPIKVTKPKVAKGKPAK